MKTKNPKFMAIYNGFWCNLKFVSSLNGPYDSGKIYTRGWGWGASLFRLAFSGSHSSNLPRNTEVEHANITDESGTIHVQLILKPFIKSVKRGSFGRILKSSTHRVFIMCDRCDHMVPAGRIHQHTC